jgi:hypothetical protein
MLTLNELKDVLFILEKKTNFVPFALISTGIVSIFVPPAGYQKYELFSMPDEMFPVKISNL